MSDPYQSLGRALVAAARRREMAAEHGAILAWLSRRLNLAALATLVALGGGAIAIAATGMLNGNPVPEPQGIPSSNAGTGVPLPGGGRVLGLRAPDPEGGLPWGMQLVRTSRGETCVQIGRVNAGQVGQLGIDGAFHNDGRFHPLAPNILPNYTSGYADIICLLPGEVMLGYAPTQDRNAEWGIGPRVATARELRTVSWGLLGPHAVSLTYDSPGGTKTIVPSAGQGAFMIVEPVRKAAAHLTIGGFDSGTIVGQRVGLGLDDGRLAGAPGTVTQVIYRFGHLTCSVGGPAPGIRHCPVLAPPPRGAYAPTRSLHAPVSAFAAIEPHRACAAAFLRDPCYRARLEFTAPYAVPNAASEYEIEANSSCKSARPSSWSVNTDIVRHQTVTTISLGYFNCTSDAFEVIFVDRAPGRASGIHPASVIVGVGRITKAPKG